MKKELKDKWVKALRSGEYTQAKEELFDGEGYCCLGVLCHIEGYTFTDYKELVLNKNQYYTKERLAKACVVPTLIDEGNADGEYLWTDGELPEALFKDFGLQDSCGKLPLEVKSKSEKPSYSALRNLAAVNDDGYTFEEIADIIEEQL